MLSILRDYALSLSLVTLILVGYGAVVIANKRPPESVRAAASIKAKSPVTAPLEAATEALPAE